MKRIPLFFAALLLAACSSQPSASPQAPGMPPPLPSGLAVRGQSAGMLDLTDNSRWQVQPAGQSASLRWRPGEPIRVVRSGHPAWPFLLTHAFSGVSALARPAPRF